MEPDRASSSAAQLSSVATTLTDLIDRVTDQAEARRAAGDEGAAQHLFEAERSLRQAARRLSRALDEMR